MPYLIYDFNPAAHITVDAVGPVGQRVFYLQASRDENVVSLIIEKEQAVALAQGLQELLEMIENKHPRPLVPQEIDVHLKEPVIPEFRVGSLALAYDADQDLLIIVAHEMVADEEDESTAMAARFAGSREQMQALCKHARQVVAAGRPLCPMCGEAIDPTGHFCPRRNGHRT